MTEVSWMHDNVRLFQVARKGMADLFIGGVGREAAAFYDVNDLAAWFLDQQVPEDSPVWEFIESLPVETK